CRCPTADRSRRAGSGSRRRSSSVRFHRVCGTGARRNSSDSPRPLRRGSLPPWSRTTPTGTVDRSAMEPVIHLRSAVCLLGRFPALAGVDLDVEGGEIVLLQGPNGAGKTTVLRACAGLLPFTDGEAVVLGHDLRVDRVSVRPRIGLLGHATG